MKSDTQISKFDWQLIRIKTDHLVDSKYNFELRNIDLTWMRNFGLGKQNSEMSVPSFNHPDLHSKHKKLFYFICIGRLGTYFSEYMKSSEF